MTKAEWDAIQRLIDNGKVCQEPQPIPVNEKDYRELVKALKGPSK